MITIGNRLLGQLSGRRRKAWLPLLLAVLLAYPVLGLHLHEHLYFWLKFAGSPAPVAEAGLPQYRVRVEAQPVAGVDGNLSGLSYDDDRQQLWAVINNPPELLAMSTAGEVLERYPLHGFQDVEAVAYLGDDQLLLADERRQELVIVPRPGGSAPLQRADYRALTLDLGNPERHNSGLEGLGYDRAGDRLFVVKEHSPRKLYEIRGLKASLRGDFSLAVIDRDAWIRHKNFVSDLSSVEFDARSGHLLLLSDASQLMMELGMDGQLFGYRSLWRASAGLEQSVPQAEGVALDARGNLYLVSEPNLFYVFSREG
ncbi:SdiA-regulated domain-containing protein [Pseudomonas sp. AN-1]|uniref:SdiA-regulated domain-containing protein n=1 Tax=Pseudomonas sp. AN-1 TaxID=3096605 RepID=UPI002A6AA0E9|nr:SdiA-regulated domain-containing protein [Pseudomonas sp. AN-1]WPP44436.1 SdiA-regulated domain-containing protein [Pseudomonas sp. AN-1]